MTGETNERPLDEHVEEIIGEAQKLRGIKQRVLQELSDRGEDVDGVRIIAAHRLGDQMRTTEVTDGQG
jgi:hypothetical protein